MHDAASHPAITRVATGLPDEAIEAKPGARAIDDNYQYWRDHGGEWADEYDSRKRDQVYYHVQELMLVEFVEQCVTPGRPLDVLEFGCGVGRHLRNLDRVEGVRAFGFDQSPSMVAQCARWAGEAWMASRVRVGEPTGRLPYPDGAFDVVYTAEVLVHVRPEHLAGVLRELVRVARGQVFHLETSPEHTLVPDEHSGCWWHDLVRAYDAIGVRCERLPTGYSVHAPYRVPIDPGARTGSWSPLRLELYRRLERDIDAGFNAIRGDRAAWRAQAERNAEGLERALAELGAARREGEAARAGVASRDARIAELSARLEQLVDEGERLLARAEGQRAELARLRPRLRDAERALGDLRLRFNATIAREGERIEALEREVQRAREEAWRAAAREGAMVNRVEEILRPDPR